MKFIARTETLIATFFGFWVLVAICLQTWGVLSRNVLNLSTAWLDDVQRLNFIWLIWILAALAYGTRGLIRLDLLQAKLSSHARAYHAVSLGIAIVELIFGLSLLLLSLRIIRTHLSSGETTVAISLPVWVLTAGFVLGCLLLTAFAFYNSLLGFQRLIRNTPVRHENDLVQEVGDTFGVTKLPSNTPPDLH